MDAHVTSPWLQRVVLSTVPAPWTRPSGMRSPTLWSPGIIQRRHRKWQFSLKVAPAGDTPQHPDVTRYPSAVGRGRAMALRLAPGAGLVYQEGTRSRDCGWDTRVVASMKEIGRQGNCPAYMSPGWQHTRCQVLAVSVTGGTGCARVSLSCSVSLWNLGHRDHSPHVLLSWSCPHPFLHNSSWGCLLWPIMLPPT